MNAIKFEFLLNLISMKNNLHIKKNSFQFHQKLILKSKKRYFNAC